MQFAEPSNLWSLLVIVPMLGAYVGWWWWKRRRMEALGDKSMLRQMAASQSPRLQVARAVLFLLGTLLLCLALAQPQWGQTNRPIKRTGVDVVFALDLSASMNAQDIAPTRLEAAKNEIETTLEVLRGDRVGLVVFTAVSFVQTPLTTDYGAIRFYLDRLQPGQMPLGGTSLGRAVVDSVELLTGTRVGGEDNDAVEMPRAKNQVVVLITDGEDHESDPRSAAQLAATNDIKVVTVGLGSDEGVFIPVYRPDGQLSGYKRDRDGNKIRTSLDSGTLEMMAEQTGGVYVPYSGENSVANALVSYINALEKSEIESMLKERYRERYQFFALPGLLLLILSLLLGERRPRRRDRKKAASVALVLLVALFASGCERAFEDTLSSVDRGNEFIETGEFEKALEAYRQAETEIPARPELHYDLGRALLGLQRWDEAADAFARSLETDDISLRFDALHNLALTHAGREAWRESWETNREALVLAARHPGSVDSERVEQTRHNLEVAWRKFYPPCSDLEDEHEENDSPEQPTQLKEPKVSSATLCGQDDDWFVIQAIPGTRVSVNAKFRRLREDPEEQRPFLPRPADLQIALFDQTGQQVHAVDQGGASAPTGETTTRTIDKFMVDETMVSAETPFVLLKVNAAAPLEFEYDLEIESIPPCHALEEQYEDNDSPEQAKLIEAGNFSMHHCPDDEDWFTIDAKVGDSVFLDLQVSPDAEREVPAELELALFDESGRRIADAEREGAYLTLGVRDIRDPQRFLVRVAGASSDEQGPYQLDVYQYEPCIVGDDRFEENDTANAASVLDRQQPVHRYLRACDGDLDYYRIDFDEDETERKVQMGLARIATPAPGTDPTEEPPFEFDLVSPTGGQIVTPGEAVQPVGQPEEGEGPPIPLAMVVSEDEVEGDSAFLRVAGEHEFYHLVQLDPQQQQNDQDDQSEQDQPDEGEEEQDDSDEQNDGESGDEQESDEEESGGDEQDKGEEEPEEPSPGEQQNDDADEKKPTPADQRESEMGRIEDILEALEETDDNFQMRKALENVPGRYIEKDW